MFVGRIGKGGRGRPRRSGSLPSAGLVFSENITKVGDFYVPYSALGAGMAAGGGGLSYNPANNSLFMVHEYDGQGRYYAGNPDIGISIVELSIPAMGGTATRLQEIQDPTEGKYAQISSSTQHGLGTLVHGSTLFYSPYTYYGDPAPQGDPLNRFSHFTRSTTLTPASGTVSDAIALIGASPFSPPNHGIVAGSMAHIPSEWQAALGGDALTGMFGVSVIGRASMGPSLHAFSLNSPSGSLRSLVYYPYVTNHMTLGGYGDYNSNITWIDKGTGIVFVPNTRSVLVFGLHGNSAGTYNMYGFPTDDVSLHGTVHDVTAGVTNYWVYDPDSSGSKGEHAYPYKAYCWAYDADDLAAAAAGTINPWDVLPYATWEMEEPASVTNRLAQYPVGAAINPATSELYIAWRLMDPATFAPYISKFEINL